MEDLSKKIYLILFKILYTSFDLLINKHHYWTSYNKYTTISYSIVFKEFKKIIIEKIVKMNLIKRSMVRFKLN